MSGVADLEARLLASIPSVEAFDRLEIMGISEDSFATYGPLFVYIREMVEEHDRLPRLLDVKETFNIPDWVKRETGEWEWLLQEFLKLTTAQRIQTIVDGNVDAYGDDPRALVDGLLNDLGRMVINDEREVSVTDAALERRLEHYRELAETQGDSLHTGIPTGLRYFDANCRIGWLSGELIGVVARTYLGKSWVLLYFGLIAWQAGRRVLFLSPELPEDEAEARWDTLLCGMNGVAVDALDFYRGIRPSKKMVALAERTAERSDWHTLCGLDGRPFTLGEVPRLIDRFEPDLVLIDGLAFLRLPGRSMQPWERIYDLSYGLKSMANNHGVPIIVSHQANRGAADTGRAPGLHEIAMGDAFAQACDRIIVLSKPAAKTRPKDMVVTVQKFRKGEPEQGGIHLHFDPGRGKIDEVSNPRTTGTSGRDGTGLQTRKGDASQLPIP